MKKRTKIPAIEIARAATNAPELSREEFTLGDRKFKVVDLPYDDYLRFTTYLGPMLELLFGSLVSMSGIKAPTANVSLTPAAILQYAGESLPELACIVCTQTDPTMTVAQVKLLAQGSSPRGPFKLAEIVLKQVEQNKIINDFASFFGQMLPLLKAALSLK